jgi:hypothetical protein
VQGRPVLRPRREPLDERAGDGRCQQGVAGPDGLHRRHQLLGRDILEQRAPPARARAIALSLHQGRLDKIARSLGRQSCPTATIADLTAGEQAGPSPEVTSLREQVADLDRKLASYRATLDAGADPAVVSQWITETQARKLAAEARLRAQSQRGSAPSRMTKEEITAMVAAITDVLTVLRTADPADKAELYPPPRSFRVRTYAP